MLGDIYYGFADGNLSFIAFSVSLRQQFSNCDVQTYRVTRAFKRDSGG